jgi:hypothetical protein
VLWEEEGNGKTEKNEQRTRSPDSNDTEDGLTADQDESARLEADEEDGRGSNEEDRS